MWYWWMYGIFKSKFARANKILSLTCNHWDVIIKIKVCLSKHFSFLSHIGSLSKYIVILYSFYAKKKALA